MSSNPQSSPTGLHRLDTGRQHWFRQAGNAATAATAVAASLACHGEFDAEKYLVYSFGDLSLRPRLEVSEVYNSNLYYGQVAEIDDFATFIRPGLNLVYGDSQESFISLSYATDIAVYATQHELDYVGHILNHHSEIKRARTTLSGQDSFSLGRSTLGGSFSYIKKPIGSSTLNDDWKVDYEVSPKAMAGVEVQYNWVDYNAADFGPGYHLYDYQGITGSTRFGYTPSEKIVLYPQFSFTRSFLSPNKSNVRSAPDLSSIGFSVGAQGEFTPKLTGTISGGYEIREYEDNTQVPDGWIANVELRWQARPKTSVALGFRHWIQVTRDAVGISYNADRPSLTLTQELGTQGRWNVSASGYYQFDDYNADYVIAGRRIARTDDYAGIGFRTSYRWTAWLTTSASYDFTTYRDNLPTVPDYDVHLFTLLATAGF